MADEEQHTGVGIFLLPEASDPIVAASSEPAHLTTVWLGDMNDLDEDTIGAIRAEAAAYAAELEGPVVVPVASRGLLGDDDADVAFLERTEALQALREGLLEHSPTIKRVMDSVEQFPEWTPHVTLGYPETPAAGEYDGEAVTFDRVGLWVGPEQEEYPMSGKSDEALTAGGTVNPGVAPLVGEGPGSPAYVIPKAALERVGMTAERFEHLALVAAGQIEAEIDPTVEQELLDDLEDDEMPLDELDDDEEEITEIPVHGVATVEGRATGDGRGFKLNALDLGQMPQPLGYEFVSTHGGDTSHVAIVGRIDSYERKELEDGVVELRWRGVIMPGKEYGAKAIESIIDGSYTGLSVVVDSVELDVEEERETFRRRILAERSGETAEEDEEFDIEQMLDDIVGDGTRPTQWFRSARVRRFDMVPTGAFQEAYIALGHEFADELTEEALVAAAAALEDCGCTDSLAAAEAVIAEFRDISADERKRLAEEGEALPDGSFPIANVEDLRNAIQSIGRASDPEEAKAHIRKRARELDQEDLIPEDWDAQVEALIAAAFAPGTKDGPGWITHPIPTSRIRRYWVRGKGAAKINWGVPGDFNRCRAQLAKYVQNPDWLAGLCANMHKEAIGVWPGQERGGRHGLTASAEPAPLFSLVAAADPIDADYFERRELANPRVGVIVDGDHVYGYIAQWNVCHVGQPEGPGTCTLAPHSPSNYAQFRTGTVMTTRGPVSVGQITMNTGHARGDLSARSTVAHYDNTGAAVADIVCGEDRFGIWFAGRIRPNVSEEDRFALAASGRLSGDWRVIGGAYELVAALAVNVPGFPIPEVSLAASASGPLSLVAAGVIRPEEIDEPVDEEALAATPLTPADIAAIAMAAAEEVLHLQRRQEIIDRTAPAREKLAAHRLAAARAKLATHSKG